MRLITKDVHVSVACLSCRELEVGEDLGGKGEPYC